MIVDTSVLMALLLEEKDRDDLMMKISRSTPCLMSAGSWIELGAVLGRREDDLSPLARQFVEQLGIAIVPVSANQADIGHRAYREFGRGRHPARLNFGDCFSYALAKESGMPLLFKGDDFTQTDITSAM